MASYPVSKKLDHKNAGVAVGISSLSCLRAEICTRYWPFPGDPEKSGFKSGVITGQRSPDNKAEGEPRMITCSSLGTLGIESISLMETVTVCEILHGLFRPIQKSPDTDPGSA